MNLHTIEQRQSRGRRRADGVGRLKFDLHRYLGNRASAGLARFASRGGAAADPFGAPPAADTEVIQRRGNNAPAPVPAAAPMDRKGR